MRLFSSVLALGFVLAGCGSPDAASPPTQPSPRTTKATRPSKGGSLDRSTSPSDAQSKTNRTEASPVVLPAGGRIHSVHPGLQFVVVDYTLGGAPILGSTLFVYRGGNKVGQLRLTGPERNGFIAGDVTEGIIQVDDEVRSQ